MNLNINIRTRVILPFENETREYKINGFVIRDVFKVGRRLCVVVEGNVPFIGNYCCGYVQVLSKNKGKHYDGFIDSIETDEITFGGNLNKFNCEYIGEYMFFLGFDTAHSWNEEHPESKLFLPVKRKTIELAREMIRKRI